MFQIIYNFQLLKRGGRVLKEKPERSHRETSGRELGLGLRSQNNLYDPHILVDCIHYNQVGWRLDYGLAPLSKRKSTSFSYYSCIIIHRHVQIKKIITYY